MRLSLVLHLLVLVSVLSLTRAQTTLADPCYKYTVLDDPRRSPDYLHPQQICDDGVSGFDWYRLSINGQNAQMPTTCVIYGRCGTGVSIWLNGAHPSVEDGEVTRSVCGSYLDNCCYNIASFIEVKACPGGYFVYKFQKPTFCNAAYCAEVSTPKSNLADPCYKYTVLDDPRRSPDYLHPQQICDNGVSGFNWYRLSINGQNAQMPTTCVIYGRCGTGVSIWLNGAHPSVEDGEVTRSVCGSYLSNCCYNIASPIIVKACPGGYFIYMFQKPAFCNAAYCAEVSNFNTPESTLAAPAIFYSFGSEAGDTRNPALDDGSSDVIQLSSPFLFFGCTYQQIYVNNNGHLTFNEASSEFTPYSFPANRSQDIIAGLWTDLDNRAKGVVSYQQYTDGSVLTNITRDINTYFPNLNWNISWVFVATWNKVAYFDITNTDTSFQVVLVSGTNYSFILMNYGDIAVTEHPVQAGYDTINSTHYFVIPESINGSFISNLRNSSNVDVPGRWVFRVDSEQRNSILNNHVVGFQLRVSSFLDLTQSGNTDVFLQQIKQELIKKGLPNSIELKLRKLQKLKP